MDEIVITPENKALVEKQLKAKKNADRMTGILAEFNSTTDALPQGKKLDPSFCRLLLQNEKYSIEDASELIATYAEKGFVKVQGILFGKEPDEA